MASKKFDSILTSIIPHIEYLLQRNDCVILPGIGAIVAGYVASTIDFETGRITPPQRRISLNPAINHDDGMLATSISRAEQIKFEDARELMRRAMTDIRNILESEREYPLGRYGRLTLGEEDRLVFEPSRTCIEEAREMGQPTINPVGDVNEAPERKGMKATEVEAPKLAPHTYTRVLSDKNYYIAINKVFARCAAAAIILVVMVLPFIMPREAQSPNQINASLNPVESLTSSRPAAMHISENEQSATTTQPVDAKAEEPEVNSSTAPDADMAEATEEIQYLIVATFRSEKQAREYLDKHQDSEFALRAIEHKGVYRISAACGDNATLRGIMSTSDFTKSYPGAWIWGR